MKKLLLLFIIAFMQMNFTSVKAQTYHPFPTDSAQWSIRHTHNSPFSQNSYQYKMKGDTIINGNTYSKIYYSLDLNYDSPNQILHCFLREDTTKKVYVKYPAGSGIDTTEFILYNFNLTVGDTVTIRLLYYSTDSLFKLTVASITIVPTPIDTRKDFLLSAIDPPIWGGNCDYFEWIEGIGGNSLFYNEIVQNGCMNTDDYYTSCFWDHGIYIIGGTFCDYSTIINENSDETLPAEIFPNPIFDKSVLNINHSEISNIKIYDLLGKIVKDFEIIGQKKIILKKADFSTGVFIYKLSTLNGNYRTGKFIVQ